MIYVLPQNEKQELISLEKELFYSNGIPKKDISINNIEKVIRLKILWDKQRELKLANLN